MAQDQPHWAFRPLARTAVPGVARPDRVRTPVDAFVAAALEARGLSFSADAEPVALLRRATFDLVGLPPEPWAIDAFLEHSGPEAYEHLIDRLLASPQFGERWGRHWLDVAGYTDTVGFDIDATLVIQSEGKWRYRDYVIRAFNSGKPFDQFITEQLAGDELVDWRNAGSFTPDTIELLVATGFLRTAQDYSHEPESNIPLTHYSVLHDTLEIVGNSLLGLTLNCARCHDHKFDPVTQHEYYQLMALFTPAYNPNNWKAVTPYKPGIEDRSLADVSPAERAAIERHNDQLNARIAGLQEQIEAIRRPHQARLFEARLAAIPEPIRQDTRAAIETGAEKRTEVQKYLADKFGQALKVSAEDLAAALPETDSAAINLLNEQIAALAHQRRTFGKIQALFDVGPPPATHVLQRGNHESPGPEVTPGFLRMLDDAPLGAAILAETRAAGSSGRRLALARWLTARDSRAAALLARVMVNRVWQHLLGQGLVASAENFGLAGERPSHPELLDWLSAALIDNGWQLKPLIKTIMMSTVYRQASQRSAAPGAAGAGVEASGAAPEAVDPENRLLWRARLRRLESEAIRDAVLATSGRLDRQAGGPPVMLAARPDGLVLIAESGQPAGSSPWRRSVYLLARHQYHLSMLTVFDQPVLATNCPQRVTSAVPLQSLMMLNDAFLMEQAGYFAQRALQEAAPSNEARIDWAFRAAFGRPASQREMGWCLQTLLRQAALLREQNATAAQAEKSALAHLCQVLWNTSEFLYVP